MVDEKNAKRILIEMWWNVSADTINIRGHGFELESFKIVVQALSQRLIPAAMIRKYHSYVLTNQEIWEPDVSGSSLGWEGYVSISLILNGP